MIAAQVKISGNTRGLKMLVKKIKDAEDAYVTVGVHEDAGSYKDGQSVVMVALWNEFGTNKTPERSFLRSTINGNVGLINKWREEVIGNILNKDWTVEKALTALGFRVQILIQNAIKSDIGPPNAAYTVERKRLAGIAPRTLIETGLLLRSIGFKVFTKTGEAKE